MSHKKVQRPYREESLSIRRKKRKRVAQLPREPKPAPSRVDERWSMDSCAGELGARGMKGITT